MNSPSIPFLVFVLALGTMLSAGCGGGGAGPSANQPEQSTQVGSFSVRSVGSLQEPVIVTGIGATAVGMGGRISGIQWMAFSDSSTRDDVAYIARSADEERVNLRVASLDQRYEGLVESDVVEGPTAWTADGSNIYVLKNVGNTVRLGTVPAFGRSGFTQLVAPKTSVSHFAVSSDDRYLAYAISTIGTAPSLKRSDLLLFDRSTLTIKTLESNKVIGGITFFGAFNTLAVAVSDESRPSLKQFSRSGTLLSSTAVDGKMQSFIVTIVNGLQQLVVLNAGNSTSGTVSTGSLQTPNTLTPILSFIFPDGYVSGARGSNRFLVSQSATSNAIYVSGHGTAAMRRITHMQGGSASLFSRPHAPLEIGGTSMNALINFQSDSVAEGTIFTSAAAPNGAQTFGSAVVFTGNSETVKISTTSSTVSGAQMVLTASAPEGATLTDARFVNSVYGGPTSIKFSGETTQAVVVLDSRSGAVTNIIAVSGSRSSTSQIVLEGETLTLPGAVLGAWDAKGSPVKL